MVLKASGFAGGDFTLLFEKPVNFGNFGTLLNHNDKLFEYLLIIDESVP